MDKKDKTLVTQPKLHIDKDVYKEYCDLLRKAGRGREIEEFNSMVFQKAVMREIEALKRLDLHKPTGLYSELMGGNNAETDQEGE